MDLINARRILTSATSKCQHSYRVILRASYNGQARPAGRAPALHQSLALGPRSLMLPPYRCDPIDGARNQSSDIHLRNDRSVPNDCKQVVCLVSSSHRPPGLGALLHDLLHDLLHALQEAAFGTLAVYAVYAVPLVHIALAPLAVPP